MTDVTTLLLVDGDAGAMRGLRMCLALEHDLRVVGEACWGDDLAAIAGALAPDVVVVDVDRPEAGPATSEVVRTLAAAHRVVVITLHDDRATADAVRASGAAAFVRKHEGVACLLDAIRAAAGSAQRGPPVQ